MTGHPYRERPAPPTKPTWWERLLCSLDIHTVIPGMSVEAYLDAYGKNRTAIHLCARCGTKVVFLVGAMDWIAVRRARQDPELPKCICRVTLGSVVEYWDNTDEEHALRCSCGGTRLNHPYRCDGSCVLRAGRLASRLTP